MSSDHTKTTLQMELVAKANAHLADNHPDLAGKYSRDEILFMSGAISALWRATGSASERTSPGLRLAQR